MNRFLIKLCNAVEISCVLAVGAIGLKCNNEAYKSKLACAERDLKIYEQRIKIRELEKTIQELKNN